MTDTAEITDETPQDEPAKSPWWERRYTFIGTALGLVFIWLSLTPSLLPRGPLFQGLVSGAAGAIGYGIGVFLVWLARYMRSKDSSPPAPQVAWIALVVIGVIGQILMIIYFHIWQDEVRDLNGVPRLGFWDHPLTAVLSIVVLFIFVEIGQLIGRLVRFLVRQARSLCAAEGFGCHRRRPAARTFHRVAQRHRGPVRDGHDQQDVLGGQRRDRPGIRGAHIAVAVRRARLVGHVGIAWPPGSGVRLGRTHRSRSSRSSTAGPRSSRSGPMRGCTPPTASRRRPRWPQRNFERKGGLDRAVVAVATTTGTGWINEAEASSLEYMYNGDTAIVSMQYSFLPSWLSFLVDKENARQAGQALFEAVDAMIREMPEAQRPQLVVFGESLGSFGGEAPFLALNNLVARTDGALFSGPTFNNTIWTQLTRDRDAGSPEWLPIFDKGENVRFAARSDNLNRPGDPWGHPRVVYLQHASDPIAGSTRICCSPNPIGSRNPRATTCQGACSGFRS